MTTALFALLLCTALREEPPAVVHPPASGEGMPTVELGARAEARLGIEVAAAERVDVPDARWVAGAIAIPPGSDVSLVAPVAGRVVVAGDAAPRPGQEVEAGRPLFRLEPVLSPEHGVPTPTDAVQLAETRARLAGLREEARGRLAAAVVREEAARKAFERARALRASDAGSERALDEAHAQLEVTRAERGAAEAMLKSWESVTLESAVGAPDPFVLSAPFEGTVLDVGVASGQVVPAGAELLRLARLEPLWVRVRVPASWWSRVDLAAQAWVEPLGAPTGAGAAVARPVAGPPGGDAAAGTVDGWYELAPDGGPWLPGQRVRVRLALGERTSALVVPWSSVLLDAAGGQWVYERVAPRSYRRAVVLVSRVAGDRAILRRGPPVGTHVVTVGVAELFGTELGTGK